MISSFTKSKFIVTERVSWIFVKTRSDIYITYDEIYTVKTHTGIASTLGSDTL